MYLHYFFFFFNKTGLLSRKEMIKEKEIGDDDDFGYMADGLPASGAGGFGFTSASTQDDSLSPGSDLLSAAAASADLIKSRIIRMASREPAAALKFKTKKLAMKSSPPPSVAEPLVTVDSTPGPQTEGKYFVLLVYLVLALNSLFLAFKKSYFSHTQQGYFIA